MAVNYFIKRKIKRKIKRIIKILLNFNYNFRLKYFKKVVSRGGHPWNFICRGVIID